MFNHQINQHIWIKNPVFDLSLITGGAFFTLFVAFISFQFPSLLPIFFWIWVIVFEGSHFWATFSRTYMDKEFRLNNKSLLIGSMIFFVFPIFAVVLDKNDSQISFTTLYAFFIFVWSLYHNARQHFGFLSIYSNKAKLSVELKSELTKILYISIAIPQLFFLLNFKVPGVFDISLASNMSATLSFLVNTIPKLITILCALYLMKTAYQIFKSNSKMPSMPLFYIATCLIFYSVMFYLIAPSDTLIQNPNGAEVLMLIAIMNSLFHNIQYHAIVFYYGQKRYQSTDTQFGIADIINKGITSYTSFALLLGFVFGYIVWNVGDWPNFHGDWNQPSMQVWAYILFFGIIGHHFYLDQKIWRPSKQKELKEYLD